MDRKINIKVCGMRQPENIKELGQLSPEYMGLIFYPKSPRYVEAEMASGILKATPGKIKKVGVFVNSLLSEIIDIANSFKFDIVQLHGKETPQYCADIKNIGFTVIKAFGVDQYFDFEILDQYSNCCDYFLFDTKSDKHGGTGVKFDWNILRKYNNNKPVFLSGGINESDTRAILNLDYLNIHALDLNSRFEKEPGIKDIKKLKNFITGIRKAHS